MNPHWPTVKLAEVLRPVSRPERLEPTKEYRLLGVRLDGAGAFLRETKLGSQISAGTLSRVEAGDFIYSRLFAWRGAFGIISEDLDGCYVSGEFPTFAALPGKIDLKFLNYWFRLPATLEKVEADCTGSTPLTRNRFKEEFFLALEIPLPPLAEQRRIVARIEQLAAQIAEARRLRLQATEESERIVAVASKSIFSRSLPLKPLAEVTTRITKGESPKWQGFTYQDSGPLFIRSENVLWGRLDLSEPTYISKEFHAKLERSQLRPGDVLINLVGASIGRACAVPAGIAEANVNQAVAVITPDSRLNAEFLAHFLISPPAQEVLHGGKVDTARANISLGDLRGLHVPVPPLAEQRRIVAYLDGLAERVAALKQLQTETAAALDALLPSILDKAFKGEL